MTRRLEDLFQDALFKNQLHDLDGFTLSAAPHRGRGGFEEGETALGDGQLDHDGWLLGLVG